MCILRVSLSIYPSRFIAKSRRSLVERQQWRILAQYELSSIFASPLFLFSCVYFLSMDRRWGRFVSLFRVATGRRHEAARRASRQAGRRGARRRSRKFESIHAHSIRATIARISNDGSSNSNISRSGSSSGSQREKNRLEEAVLSS